MNLFLGIAWRNVLRTVPVIGLNMDHKDPLDNCVISCHPNAGHPRLSVFAFDDVRATKYFQTCLARIVNQNHCDPVVSQEISSADKLFVPSEIREGQGVIIDHLQETFGAAAMLDVRPPSGTDRRPVKAVALGQEFHLEWGEAVM